MEKKRELLLLIFELYKAIRCCQQDEVFFENLTFTQFFILDTVARNSTLRLANLHNILLVEKSTTTRLVDPLVKQQLIIREISIEDQRAVILKLTRKGEEVHSKVWECITGFIHAVEERIPVQRREEVYEAVRIFAMALRDSCSEGQCARSH